MHGGSMHLYIKSPQKGKILPISIFLLSCRNGCCAFCITVLVHTMSKMSTRVNIEC